MFGTCYIVLTRHDTTTNTMSLGTVARRTHHPEACDHPRRRHPAGVPATSCWSFVATGIHVDEPWVGGAAQDFNRARSRASGR